MEVKAVELKFLLKLLGFSNYRASITDEKLKPNSGTKASERDKICRGLTERGIVEHSLEIKRFKITSTGKSLLQKEMVDLPVTEKHFIVLKACGNKSITPGKVKGLASEERQTMIQDLGTRGFIEIEEVNIKEVWITEQGQEYLKQEYILKPKSTINLSSDHLNNYLRFLRKAIDTTQSSKSSQLLSGSSDPKTNALDVKTKFSDAEILQIIEDLDGQLGTENYLPIFHLRQKLQPPLSRDELDQALYRLQRQDKIDMSTLVEAIHYTSEQIQAGIPQDTGSPLFFIMLKREDSDSLML